MQKSYGVVWREGAQPPLPGKLELRGQALRLEGRDRSFELPYESVASVRIGRSNGERIDGRPAVVVERRAGPPLAIATVAQPSLLGEIAEQLASLQLGAARSGPVALVVPIKPESRGRARRLLAAGPPFDPAQVPGLERHNVYLTQREAVLVFASGAGAEAVSRLLAEPEVWPAAEAWRELMEGLPRVGQEVYSWTPRDVAAELSYLATPGPGDSDGGDIY